MMNPFLAWTEAPYSIPPPTPPVFARPPPRPPGPSCAGVCCACGEKDQGKTKTFDTVTRGGPSTDILVLFFSYLLCTCLCMLFGTSAATIRAAAHMYTCTRVVWLFFLGNSGLRDRDSEYVCGASGREARVRHRYVGIVCVCVCVCVWCVCIHRFRLRYRNYIDT